MKKILAAIIVSAFLSACGGGGSSEGEAFFPMSNGFGVPSNPFFDVDDQGVPKDLSAFQVIAYGSIQRITGGSEAAHYYIVNIPASTPSHIAIRSYDQNLSVKFATDNSEAVLPNDFSVSPMTGPKEARLSPTQDTRVFVSIETSDPDIAWEYQIYALEGAGAADENNSNVDDSVEYTQLEPGKQLTGSVDAPFDLEHYSISLAKDQRLALRLQSTTLEPATAIVHSESSLVLPRSMVSTQELGFAQEIFTAPEDIDLFIHVDGYDDPLSRGEFFINATLLPIDDRSDLPEGASSAVIQGINAQIEDEGDIDYIKYRIDQGERFSFTLSSLGIEELTVNFSSDTDGVSIPNALTISPGVIAAQDIITAEKTATYFMIFKAPNNQGNTGEYKFELTDIGNRDDDYGDNAMNAEPLSRGGGAAGDIEDAGDSDCFVTNLTTGQATTFTLEIDDISYAKATITTLGASPKLVASLIDDGTNSPAQTQFTPSSSMQILSCIESGSSLDDVGGYSFSVK